jgi:hypothetical protein
LVLSPSLTHTSPGDSNTVAANSVGSTGHCVGCRRSLRRAGAVPLRGQAYAALRHFLQQNQARLHSGAKGRSRRFTPRRVTESGFCCEKCHRSFVNSSPHPSFVDTVDTVDTIDTVNTVNNVNNVDNANTVHNVKFHPFRQIITWSLIDFRVLLSVQERPSNCGLLCSRYGRSLVSRSWPVLSRGTFSGRKSGVHLQHRPSCRRKH